MISLVVSILFLVAYAWSMFALDKTVRIRGEWLTMASSEAHARLKAGREDFLDAFKPLEEHDFNDTLKRVLTFRKPVTPDFTQA